MTPTEFLEFLRKETAAAKEFAFLFIENELPLAVHYHVLLDRFGGELEPPFRQYLEIAGREYHGLSEVEVTQLLVRDGCCPQWINISVEAISRNETRMRLVCAGRFTDDTSRMYYYPRGQGPFGIVGPRLPIRFKEGQKFKVPVVVHLSGRNIVAEQGTESCSNANSACAQTVMLLKPTRPTISQRSKILTRSAILIALGFEVGYMLVFWKQVSRGLIAGWSLPPILVGVCLVAAVVLIGYRQRRYLARARAMDFKACPACGYDLRENVRVAGNQVTCPKCGCGMTTDSLPVLWEPWRYSDEIRNAVGL